LIVVATDVVKEWYNYKIDIERDNPAKKGA
jgi:hypothetical protein